MNSAPWQDMPLTGPLDYASADGEQVRKGLSRGGKAAIIAAAAGMFFWFFPAATVVLAIMAGTIFFGDRLAARLNRRDDNA